YGQGTLINVQNGSDMTYMADALDNYADPALVNGYYFRPTSVAPALGGGQVDPFSLIMTDNLGANPRTSYAISDLWLPGASGETAGIRAVSAVFMHSSVMNDYQLDTNTLSNTDWVMT